MKNYDRDPLVWCIALASIFIMGLCVSTCSVRAQVPEVDYHGEIFRPTQALADWFERLKRRDWEKLTNEPISCCDAGDGYPIEILQEASIGGTEEDGIAEVTDTSPRMIIKPNGERKWRPEWTGPKRFKYAGNLITREIDGNPTKTAWVFAGGADRSYGTRFKIYCVVPLPPVV